MKMIVNSTMNHTQMDPHQCENFYLKRKLETESIDNNISYVQPKKRHIQNFTNFDGSCNDIQQQYNNMNNNNFVGNECQAIEFLSYDNTLPPVQTIQTTVYSNEEFDAAWQNSDLLELDQKYNSGNNTVIMEKQQTPPRSNSNPAQTESDFEDKNLSWLFNFKLDELPHLSPEINRPNQCTTPNKTPKNAQSKTGKKVDELIMEVTSEIEDSDMVVAENVVIEVTPKMPKKPPFTYTELIEYALEDKGELTVSGIYQWISDRFPYYKSNDDRWKNSVRHNLSINPHFRKGVKAPQGAGHLWTISSRDSEENALAWEHKKQRLELFFKMEMSQKRHSPPVNNNNTTYDEAATAAANIAQQLRNESLSPEQNSCHSPPDIHDTNNPISLGIGIHEQDLKKAAGEILNGIRRNVEVQAVHTTINSCHDSLLETGDYLNPINKDDIVLESGLRNRTEIGNEYYVTEIDPIELGINMSNVEEEVLFSDEFNLNYFGITAGNDIVA